ncbi:MAG: L,D-transpeptidase family protein [Burkholderiales bacterium]|nr:L,D-transpeptidase family protein [Burkholderiales bacterium]
MRRLFFVCSLASLLSALPASAKDLAVKTPISASNEVETSLVNSLLDVVKSRPDKALQGIDAILVKNPNFRLAHLIKGDLLLARAQPISTLGNTSAAKFASVDDLRQEARVRVDRYLNSPPLDLAPRHILQMSADQPYALVVDTTRSRLYVYRNHNGEPRYLTDYYISSGKNGAQKLREGDQKTPTGVYQVVANLAKSTLTDFYGPGAFPLSYPNEWDKREGRNGSGIWLHGTPSDTYSRAPRASNGCVVLSNGDLIDLAKYVNIGGTPVIISTRAEWVNPAAWQAQRQQLLSALEQWRRDWESRDIERYLSHYDPRFAADGKDLNLWSAQKRTVNSGKTFINVTLSNVSIFSYPGAEDMAVVTFDQSYNSNNLGNDMKKRQYWLRDKNRWRIVYEGSAETIRTMTAKR